MFQLFFLGSAAWAGSISAPGVHAGPDASAAVPGAAAPAYNPATLSALTRPDLLLDAQGAWVRATLTTSRNDGIDPNTGEPYRPAEASVLSTVSLVGAAAPLIPGRLGVGLSVHNPFTGGANYLPTEPDPDHFFTGHQRYHGVRSILASIAVTGALGARVVEGVHVGAGASAYFDYATLLRAGRVTADEGAPDYSNDVRLYGESTGIHPGAIGGIYIDRWADVARFGAAFQWAGRFNADRSRAGEVSVPGTFTTSGERATVPFDFGISFPLAPTVRAYADVPVGARGWTVGAGWEWQLWYLCCGDAEGDIAASVVSQDGDALGEEDGLALSIAETIYSPRRLWNAHTLALLSGGPLGDADRWWLGGQARFNQNAVPDYAVSASNLDFNSLSLQVMGRRRLTAAWEVGLSYGHVFLFTRTVTDSAWNLGDGNERFSPPAPATTSGDGTYAAVVDSLGLRLHWTPGR